MRSSFFFPFENSCIPYYTLIMESLFLHMPSRVLFGADTRLRIGTEALNYGRRALIISESVFRSTPLLAEIRTSLGKAGVEAISYTEAGPETTSRAGEACLELAKSGHVQMIIGLGGVRTLSLARRSPPWGPPSSTSTILPICSTRAPPSIPTWSFRRPAAALSCWGTPSF